MLKGTGLWGEHWSPSPEPGSGLCAELPMNSQEERASSSSSLEPLSHRVAALALESGSPAPRAPPGLPSAAQPHTQT